MNKKLSILLAGALIASAFSALPAQAAPEVPADPNVVDPRGDANGHSSTTGTGGGLTIGAADYLAVWFTNDAENLYVHARTVFPAFTYGSIWYSIYADPGVGTSCIEFRGFTEHAAVATRAQLRVTGDCGDVIEDVEMVTEEGPEDEGSATGIHTITVPRSLSDNFADGRTLAAPRALSRYYAGTDATGGAGLGVIDATDTGREYKISSGGGEPPPPAAEPPGKNDPPGQGNQNCAKIKDKKKKKECKKNSGKKPESTPPGCADFVPGERGAEVEGETAILTDEHTEEAPLEVEVALDASLNDIWVPGWLGGPSPGPLAADATGFNVQVKTKDADAGLWALLEFPERRDYDIDMFHTDGSYAARARGFNPAANTAVSASGHGGEHGTNYEKLLGIRTANCGGWTMEASNHFGEGGTLVVKLWLGPAETDPLEPGAETP